jgi:hypothetical protein
MDVTESGDSFFEEHASSATKAAIADTSTPIPRNRPVVPRFPKAPTCCSYEPLRDMTAKHDGSTTAGNRDLDLSD